MCKLTWVSAKSQFYLCIAQNFWLTMFGYQLINLCVLESTPCNCKLYGFPCFKLLQTVGICFFLLIDIPHHLDDVMLMKSYQTSIHVAKLIKILVIPGRMQQIDRFKLLLFHFKSTHRILVQLMHFNVAGLSSNFLFMDCHHLIFILQK